MPLPPEPNGYERRYHHVIALFYSYVAGLADGCAGSYS